MRGVLIALLMVFAVESQAQERHGDWEVGVTDWGVTAEVRNESGGSLGLLCFRDSQNCMYAFSVSDKCKVGNSYPVLANSDAGAQSLQVKCVAPNEGFGFWMSFQDYKAIDNLLRSGSRVGFAVPMEAGTFKVVRFSLRGSTAAIDRANHLTVQMGKNSTRDMQL